MTRCCAKRWEDISLCLRVVWYRTLRLCVREARFVGRSRVVQIIRVHPCHPSAGNSSTWQS